MCRMNCSWSLIRRMLWFWESDAASAVLHSLLRGAGDAVRAAVGDWGFHGVEARRADAGGADAACRVDQARVRNGVFRLASREVRTGGGAGLPGAERKRD